MRDRLNLDIGTARSPAELDRIIGQIDTGESTSPLLALAQQPEGKASIQQWLKEATWQFHAALNGHLRHRWQLVCFALQAALEDRRLSLRGALPPLIGAMP